MLSQRSWEAERCIRDVLRRDGIAEMALQGDGFRLGNSERTSLRRPLQSQQQNRQDSHV